MSSFQNSFGSQFYTKIEMQQPCFGISIPQKQFKRGQNTQPHFGVSNKQKINLKEFQFQQRIVLLKVQLKIQSIFNILEPKVTNIKRNALTNFKNTINPQQLNHMQQSITLECMNETFSKISNFIKRQRVKLLSKGFSNIILRNLILNEIQSNRIKNKKQQNDKKGSQMLRVHSKLDDNSLHVSDLEGDGSIYSSSKAPKVKNKELKKHKQKFDKNLNDFCSKMDQMLSIHEQNLRKK